MDGGDPKATDNHGHGQDVECVTMFLPCEKSYSQNSDYAHDESALVETKRTGS